MLEANFVILQQPRLDSPRDCRPPDPSLPRHLKVCEIHRCAAESVTSVLRIVWWWRNTEAPHLVEQRGALQAKSCSCPSRTSELPIRSPASGENFSTHLVFKGGV